MNPRSRQMELACLLSEAGKGKPFASLTIPEAGGIWYDAGTVEYLEMKLDSLPPAGKRSRTEKQEASRALEEIYRLKAKYGIPTDALRAPCGDRLHFCT